MKIAIGIIGIMLGIGLRLVSEASDARRPSSRRIMRFSFTRMAKHA